MKESIAVRSMLVDKANGQYIKAIDQKDLTDYVTAFQKNSSQTRVIIDFSPAIEYFHAEIDEKFKSQDVQQLLIQKNTVFNSWVRFRSATNTELQNRYAVTLTFESEKVMSWIHAILPESKNNYQSTGNSISKQDEAFDIFTRHIEAFIEMLLCNIHTTAIVDVKSFKNDVVLTQHTNTMREIIIDCINSEIGLRRNQLAHNSLLYQCCMEDMGINANGLLALIDSSITEEDLKIEIYKKSKIITHYEYNIPHRKVSYEWPESSPGKLKRTKILASLLQKINSLLFLIKDLREQNFEFDGSNEAKEEFEEIFNHLLPSKTPSN